MQQWLGNDLFYKLDHLSTTDFMVFFKFIYLFPSAGTWTSFSGKLKQCYKNLCFTFPICETLFFGVNQQFKQTK